MRWEELSMSDRSNLMKTYLQNGVTQLSDMRDHYNRLSSGGNLDLPVRDSTQPILRPISAGNFQDIEEESAPERSKKVITLDNLHELAKDNPAMYKEYMQRLPKEYQAKVIENASRNKYGYEGLNKAMFAASSLPLATYAGAAYSSIPKSVKTFVDIIGSIDGLRNMVSHNGISKTVRKAKEGDVVGTLLSGAGDALDFLGGASYLSTLRNNFLNRNIIAYNNISPAAYTGHGKEMAGALYDFFFYQGR